MQRLAAQGSLPLDFYPSFIRDDDPASGFAVTAGPPRFSQEYWAERQRIGVLVETHSWKPYPVRVRVTRNAIVGLLDLAAADGARWREAARAADRRARRARRHQRAAPLPGDRPRPAARVPRLRVSPRDVADLGRHRDALRPVDAADLARAAPRRGEADGDRRRAARRLHRARGLCRPGGGEAGAARHREPADRRGAAASRRPDVPRDAGDAGAEHVRGTDTGHARRRLEGRGARRPGGIAVRADRAAAARAC